MVIFLLDSIWIFLLLLFVAAFLYASVGHGGASGYLALMALFGFAPEAMKPTALLLNLFVAAVAFIHYARAGYFNWRLFVVFAVSSIPLAFVGGLLDINAFWYKKILAVLLLVAVLKLLNLFGISHEENKPIHIGLGLFLGGVIGLFSGLIGIGGGIILSPLILMLKWGKMKETAAVSALFIWVNSASGMAGQLSSGVTLEGQLWWFVLVAILGGFVGGYIGSKKLNNQKLKYMLALVLLLACVKLVVS